ncbi:MAG: 30S ribosomal protein S14 [Bdellovibrionaceae bacterium]|nr:30S ribosomal protein S14 [Pseudobdellovibrionaceae bacterium]
MAKKSSIIKNQQKAEIASRYRAKRAELRKILGSPTASWEEKEEARKKMNRLPRRSIEIRVANRCALTGRPRGNLRKFGLSRIAFRDMANRGLIPGVTKSSW